MIDIELIDTWGMEHAIRGMRNPMNSWYRSDSYDLGANEFKNCGNCHIGEYFVGLKDLDLMRRLVNSGTEHRKFMRQIFISMDITAPLYWWKEFDTYKVGTVANSCSTMHKIHAKEFTIDMFSCEKLSEKNLAVLVMIIKALNEARDKFLNGHKKDDWWQMIQLLPESYNQRRTVTMNYENAYSMIKQRENHKLDEWKKFVKVLKELPEMPYLVGEL